MDTALQALINERDKLSKELEAVTADYEAKIHNLDNSIQILSNGKYKATPEVEKYNDEDYNYIKNNEDGL